MKSLAKLTVLILFINGCSKVFEVQKHESKESIQNINEEENNISAEANTEEAYIVVFNKLEVQSQSFNDKFSRKDLVKTLTMDLEEIHKLKPAKRVFSQVLQAGVYSINKAKAIELSKDPNVAYVEKDQIIQIESVQQSPTWGLDRLDQQNLPLNQAYNYDLSGAQVNAYIIDTGILTSHQDFEGRAFSGYDFVDKDSDATDCNGHGTHVAGTVGSKTYGVAKNVKLIGVRVLDCNGSGSFSNVIAGIEWVTQNHVSPAVANMSLGGPVSQAVDDAVKAAIESGVTFALAAGNDNMSACNSSPSRVPTGITVGSSTNLDVRSSFSNYGSCVDLFAPGSDIKSLWYNSSTATNTISGTSMATPHVVGVVALYLAKHPQALPSEVAQALVAGSLSGKLSSIGSGSPNLLLNTLFLGSGGEPDPGPGPGPDPDPNPVPEVTPIQNNVLVSNLSSDRDGELFFKLEVPKNQSKLNFKLSSGSGDADLYVKFGSKPTLTEYDCRPYQTGNSESCDVNSPKEGVYYVMLRAYSNFSGVSLKGSFESLSGSPCLECEKFTGNLTGKGNYAYVPQLSYKSKSGLQRFYLKGPSNADFDLYLYRFNGSKWENIAKSTKFTSDEVISYKGVAGTYRLKVVSYSGSGSFDLYRKLP